eukprot:TRINITY_DN7372_c0_g2_i1.p1 TRINITY_DN7372_c0_g2~~TRINITY_DN7372_c0_g2_i1.p1  ORF type:complete len:937 (+),score=176.38 TRINITY_DN7372_c0_g2_i1:237-3047(+)
MTSSSSASKRRPALPGATALHSRGLCGTGQTVGIADTGVDTGSCFFGGSSSSTSSGPKVAGYFHFLGDRGDAQPGHGTHVAALAVGEEGIGQAPCARLAVVDMYDTSRVNPRYNVPTLIGSVFDPFRSVGAEVACMPWDCPAGACPGLESQIDDYVWNNPTFLPIFPSGNRESATDPRMPLPGCVSRNALCVGASYSDASVYAEHPSFPRTALRIGSGDCHRSAADPKDCDSYMDALPALFGPTAPADPAKCRGESRHCVASGSACPECAFPAGALELVSALPLRRADPVDACSPLRPLFGFVCLAQRGGCSFALKVHNCAQAGAKGVIVANRAGDEWPTLMDEAASMSGLDVSIPAVLVPGNSGVNVWQDGLVGTFPVIRRSAATAASAAVPFSSHGPLADGRMKPELVFPGDALPSAVVGASCAARAESGTSQSCGVAAGAAALVREYLLDRADPELARVTTPWASSIKALLAAGAGGPQSQGAAAQSKVGFGLPRLDNTLPFSTGGSEQADLRLILLQGTMKTRSMDKVSEQHQDYCFSVGARPKLQDGQEQRSSLVLAFPTPNAGSDLDLEVRCAEDNWRERAVNDLAPGQPDRNSNVEKVFLDVPPGQLCVVSIRSYQNNALSQPYSLVAAGPFQWRPGCELTGSGSPPPCGAHGRPDVAAGRASLKATSGCTCEVGWAGPLCAERVRPLPVGAEVYEEELRPWSWIFYSVEVCASPVRFELEVASTVRLSLRAAAAASADGGEASKPPVHLWSSTAASGTDWALKGAHEWSDGAFLFSANTSEVDGTYPATLRATLTARSVGGGSVGSGPSYVHLAVLSRERDKDVRYVLRHSSGTPCAAALGSGSRGIAAGEAGLGIGAVVAIVLAIVVFVALAATLVWRRCRGKRSGSASARVGQMPAIDVEKSPAFPQAVQSTNSVGPCSLRATASA